MPPYHIRYGGDGSPDPGLSWGDMALQCLRKYQDETRPAQIDAQEGTSMSFRELLVQAVHAAEGWKSMGLRRGDVVAVLSNNNHQLFPLTVGAVCAGLTVVAAVPSGNAAELQYALSLTHPKVVVADPGRLAAATEAAREVAPEARLLVLGGDPPAGVDTYLGLLQRGEAAEPDPDSYRSVDVGDREQHVPFVLMSSGTTGVPKGVKLRDSSLTLLTEYLAPVDPAEAKVIFFPAMLYMGSGVWLLLYSLYYGLTRVFTATPGVVPWPTIHKYKVNVWFSSPMLLTTTLTTYKTEYASRYSVDSLRYLYSGGSAMSAELQSSIERELGGLRIRQGYGITEGGLVFGPLGDERIPAGAVGKPLPRVEIRLVNPDTGADIPEGTRNALGEVRVRSAYMMHSYVGNPEATADAFDELGFYKTGDLVHQADDGYYYFVDRQKEVLKYKIYQVAPAEVEMVLLQHPAVLEACVLGRWSAADGDVPTAFVVCAPTAAGAAVTERDLQALVADKLSHYKQLRGGVFFLEHMPKTLTGKVARRELKGRLDALVSSRQLADI